MQSCPTMPINATVEAGFLRKAWLLLRLSLGALLAALGALRFLRAAGSAFQAD